MKVLCLKSKLFRGCPLLQGWVLAQTREKRCGKQRELEPGRQAWVLRAVCCESSWSQCDHTTGLIFSASSQGIELICGLLYKWCQVSRQKA